MPFATLAAIHQVTPLLQQVTPGRAMGVQRSFKPVLQPNGQNVVLACRVVPMGANDQYQQAEHGVVIRHVVVFALEPSLDERFRLVWLGPGNNTIMRCSGIPVQTHGFGRQWVLEANAFSMDNAPPGQPVQEIV